MMSGASGGNFQQQQQYDGTVPTAGSDMELEIQKLKRAKGEADGMEQLLRTKLANADEEIFELRAEIETIKAEVEYESRKRCEELEKKLAAMESQMSFVKDQHQNSERAKVRALREAEDMRQKQMLERKRLDAEKRLLATHKRKQESALIAASQSMLMTRMQQSQQSQQSPPPSRRASVSTAATAVQTEPLPDTQSSAQENAELLAKLMATSSRDLLTLFNGAGAPGAGGDQTPGAGCPQPPTPTATAAMLLSGSPHSTSSATTQVIGFSQSVFSQLAGHAQAQAQASLLTFAMETNLSHAAFAGERARELYDTLAHMLTGAATALALAPVFTKYLAAPNDLDADVLSSVLRVLYAVMHHSARFQRFLLVSSSAVSGASAAASAGVSEPAAQSAAAVSGLMSPPQSARRAAASASLLHHPRVSLPALQFASLDDFLAARTEQTVLAEAPASAESASELKQQRAKLLSALCRVVRNYAHEPSVVEHGLCVLSFWVDLGVAAPATQPDFTPLLTGNVIQDIVLAPKGSARTKRQALALLAQLLHFADVFPALEASAKKSLLLNRCAQMLASGTGSIGSTGGGSREADVATAVTGSSATTLRMSASVAATASAGTTGGGNSARDVQLLQLQIVHVLLAIVWAFPSTGVRFVLDATRGSADDVDGHRSTVFYLAQLLHHETFALRVARTIGTASDASGNVDSHSYDSLRVRLVRDAFTLLGLLARFVDLGAELDGAEHEHALLAVLELLRSKRFDDGANDSVSKTASALVGVLSAAIV